MSTRRSAFEKMSCNAFCRLKLPTVAQLYKNVILKGVQSLNDLQSTQGHLSPGMDSGLVLIPGLEEQV